MIRINKITEKNDNVLTWNDVLRCIPDAVGQSKKTRVDKYICPCCGVMFTMKDLLPSYEVSLVDYSLTITRLKCFNCDDYVISL